ncbi:hypothetical protein [Pseudomonas sp.]|uniref:hypothetical protein n=1 Tax=Pseudomonas sp. TaxID=306 RepID=UPI0028A987D1|nr:hypothetical protein [Pseudomonas sp.]
MTLIMLTFFPAVTLGEEINYQNIADAKSARVENTLVRYFRIYGEPCANIQTIKPKSWSIIETVRICQLDGLSFQSDVADAYFSNPEFSKKGINLQLSITPLAPTGEQKKKCFIPIKDKHIGAMTCMDEG